MRLMGKPVNDILFVTEIDLFFSSLQMPLKSKQIDPKRQYFRHPVYG